MQKQSSLILKYIRHRLRSRSKFDLHSPFIFEIWSKILKDDTNYPEYMTIEKLRLSLLKEQQNIEFVDMGAGSGEMPFSHRHNTIQKIVRKSSVTPVYGQLLFRLAKHFKPSVLLELGTSMGISTSYLAMGNPLGQLTTIEGCNEITELAGKNFDRLKLTNIHQVIGNFNSTLPHVLMDMDRIDMVFIDGNHRKNTTLEYFYQCLQHFNDDSVLILDDIHWSWEMEEAWNEIKANTRVTITIDLFRMGLVFFRTGLSKEDFILHF